jgi:putative SOS response-associated peptidase YedK
MPVVLAVQSWAARLGATPVTERELKAMLQPYSFRAMAFWPVERKVGNMCNDSPDLFTPLRQ